MNAVEYINKAGQDADKVAGREAQIIRYDIGWPPTSGKEMLAAATLLKALLLRVALGHDFKPEEKTPASVHQLLLNPQGEEFLDQMFNKDALAEDERPCLKPYQAFQRCPEPVRHAAIGYLACGLELGDLDFKRADREPAGLNEGELDRLNRHFATVGPLGSH